MWNWRFVFVNASLCRHFGRRVARQKYLAALVVSWFWLAAHNVTLVVVVSSEKLLHTVPSQLCFALSHCLGIFPLLIVDVICVKVVDIDIGNIG